MMCDYDWWALFASGGIGASFYILIRLILEWCKSERRN